jgi:uncharacterized membrane protein
VHASWLAPSSIASEGENISSTAEANAEVEIPTVPAEDTDDLDAHPDMQWSDAQIKAFQKQEISRLPLSCADMVSNFVARIIGSWPFFAAQAFFIGSWLMGNSMANSPFDPSPFVFLNLILSFQAEFSASFISMSESSGEERDRQRFANFLEKLDIIYKAGKVLNTQPAAPAEQVRAVIEKIDTHVGVEKPTPPDVEPEGNASIAYLKSLGKDASSFVGLQLRSWKYVCVLALGFATWIVVNKCLSIPVDPFPFFYLNLLLSSLAALNSPILMMDANGHRDHERLVQTRAHMKLDIILRAQREILWHHVNRGIQE